MDIEKLTKHQIVLLTLLVSFVTSIATGIVTVSLMNQAPPEISRTINQIIEHTVEKVVPQELPAIVTNAPAAPVVTKETTVVVKDDDLAVQSIAKVQQGMVRIVSLNDRNTLVSRGIIVNENGAVYADRGSLEPLGTTSFEAILPSGERMPAVMRVPTSTTSIAILDLKLATTTKLSPVALADPAKLNLGQSVIRIGGSGADTVGTGVVARLPLNHQDLIQASVVSTTPGSVIMTIFGEVIGIVTRDSLAQGSDFYSIAPR